MTSDAAASRSAIDNRIAAGRVPLGPCLVPKVGKLRGEGDGLRGGFDGFL
jgi:hypothetical protein